MKFAVPRIAANRETPSAGTLSIGAFSSGGFYAPLLCAARCHLTRSRMVFDIGRGL